MVLLARHMPDLSEFRPVRVGRAFRTPLFLGLLAAELFACASCRSQQPATGPSAASHPSTMIARAADPPPPNEVDRLSELHPILKDLLSSYSAKEGDGHRGDEFAMLASQLDQTRFGESLFGLFGTRTHPADRATE